METTPINIQQISIHALREEGDCSDVLFTLFFSYFNPRPPRGGRQYLGGGRYHVNIFQSTPSARRATRSASKRRQQIPYFNPRPPRGGRPRQKSA